MPIKEFEVVFILEITLHDIKRFCPVYKKGNRIIIDDPKVVLDKTDELCSHALSTILHYMTVLEVNKT
jgi:uncharacterized repeat protein (TIGR04076 family)